MRFMFKIISLIAAIKVFFRSTVRNTESVFLNRTFLNLLKHLGITINDSLITVEGKYTIFSCKTNSGIESIQIDEINTKINLKRDEKFAYVAIKYSNLLKQLILQKNLYQFLYLISLLFRDKNISYLKESISTCDIHIKTIKKKFKLINEKDDFSFDSWFLQNIQYSYNDKSKITSLNFKSLFILKSSLGFKTTNQKQKQENKTYGVNNYLTENDKNIIKIPQKVFIFYIDNLSYFSAENKYSEAQNYPLFLQLLKSHNLKNFRFSSTTDWTFPAAISFF